MELFSGMPALRHVWDGKNKVSCFTFVVVFRLVYSCNTDETIQDDIQL